MKVLQILPELNIGGVERGCLDLSGQLIRQGHQSLVISNGGSLVKDLEAQGARHIRIAVHSKSLFSILASIPKVEQVLRQEKIDIVHARSRIPALIAFLACRRTGTKFITTCHGYYSQNFFSRVMGWGKLVIVSSGAIAQHMTEDFGVPSERLRLIPRGVDLEEFKFQNKTRDRKLTQTKNAVARDKSDIFTIGVIGRLTPIKGHKYFLQALARVIRVLPKVRALLVGDISPGKEKYKEELLMLTRRLSLNNYVEFMGRQSDIPQILRRLDVLVLPSVAEEAFGRVLIEAGALGVPVIASKVGGVVDIIQDEINGILVEPKDPVDLASAMIRIFNQPQLSHRLALKARAQIEEKFTLQQMTEKTIKVYAEAQTSLKILVIKLSAMGDVILAGPSLRALRKQFPRADITVLLSRPYLPILEHCPYTNRVLGFPIEKIGYRQLWRESVLLRRLDFDMVVDLQNSRRSHLLAYLTGCNKRYGYDNGKWGFLLNCRVKDNQPLAPIKHQARTLKLLGIESVQEDLELWPTKDDESWAQGFLQQVSPVEDSPLIGINLGASIAWPSKRWSIEHIASLLDKLRDSRMQVLLTGKPEDQDLAKRLRQLNKNKFIDAVGQSSILQLFCLIKRCQVYITSDSAPLHMAYVANTPVVALFGPTDPRKHTLARTKQVVIRKELPCSPCYKRRCRRHICMNEITVEKVFQAVSLLLKIRAEEKNKASSYAKNPQGTLPRRTSKEESTFGVGLGNGVDEDIVADYAS